MSRSSPSFEIEERLLLKYASKQNIRQSRPIFWIHSGVWNKARIIAANLKFHPAKQNKQVGRKLIAIYTYTLNVKIFRTGSTVARDMRCSFRYHSLGTVGSALILVERPSVQNCGGSWDKTQLKIKLFYWSMKLIGKPYNFPDSY